VTPPPRWSCDLLGGSSVAFGPRVSPDGHTVAFQAMVDNLTQVAVMNPDSGNWAVLTHDRMRGGVREIAWSPDGSKLYFDRFISKPEGIYTVPSLGGDERLVLEDAAGPAILPDGSLLVLRIDLERKQRIYHYWPDSGRLQSLGGCVPGGPVTPLRVFPDGREAVFFGMADGMNPEGSPHLYALDISSGKARQLSPQLPIGHTSFGFPLAPTPDNRSVLIDLPSGSLHQIAAIPRSGSGPVEVLMTVTTLPWMMDAGPDGSVYLDQVERPLEVLRFPISGGTPEVVADSENYPPEFMQPVEFSDGRFLLPALVSGRARLLISKPGGNFFPLMDTAEETRPPAALLPDNEVAFIAGTGSHQTIAITSALDGRIVRRLGGVMEEHVPSLAASPDGRTLYYVASGSVWAIPAADGTPRKMCTGDGIAVDPRGKELIVNLDEKAGTRLVRLPLSGEPGHDIHVQSDLPISPVPLGGNGIRKDGKLLVGVAPRDSWFYAVAMLDTDSGKLTKVSLNYTGDIMVSGWANDGRVLATGLRMRADVWRFRPIQ
jgi:eukaryotic-like serine/threonine-protein kinase